MIVKGIMLLDKKPIEKDQSSLSINELCQQNSIDNMFELDSIQYYHHIDRFWHSNNNVDDDDEIIKNNIAIPDSRIGQLFYGSFRRHHFYSGSDFNTKGFTGFMFIDDIGKIFRKNEFVLISRTLLDDEFVFITGIKDHKTGHLAVDYKSIIDDENDLPMEKQNLAKFMQFLIPNRKFTTDLTIHLDWNYRKLFVIIRLDENYAAAWKSPLSISMYDMNKDSLKDIIESKQKVDGLQFAINVIGTIRQFEQKKNSTKLILLTQQHKRTFVANTFDGKNNMVQLMEYETMDNVMTSLFNCGHKNADDDDDDNMKVVKKMKKSSSSSNTMNELNNYAKYINYFLSAVITTLMLTACMIPYFIRRRQQRYPAIKNLK
ncbi:hypothetical protein HUG17_9928 [Dermatophagoides farinae]|uniref:Uncharacterized protein n=1 Tax=Dermatophagoides farinae TaxID=6954 RepID=A0A9D4SIJ5_DERFA|nr:hypothetical protein HUG17_9928 [Dermatophagoides farinae]